MKHLKKILALVLIAVSLFTVALPAMAEYCPASRGPITIYKGGSPKVGDTMTRQYTYNTRISFTVSTLGVNGINNGITVKLQYQKAGSSSWHDGGSVYCGNNGYTTIATPSNVTATAARITISINSNAEDSTTYSYSARSY